VVAASKWDTSQGAGQAAFVSLRPRQPGDASDIVGWLSLNGRSGVREVHEANSLHLLEPGTVELRYVDPDGRTSHLPIPIVDGWDTHIFILTVEGRAQLATASVSMRPAGAGFDPSDALIDAYERGIADLVTGGPGPDQETLDNLLWGKYRNPLFGLLGAHFLIRKLRRDTLPDPQGLERLAKVARNLGELLGVNAPDVVALRLWRQLISGQQPTERFESDLPLFNVGFQAFVEATALSDVATASRLDEVALGLDANSPWTLWRPVRTTRTWATWGSDPTPHSTFGVESESIIRLRAIENAWREEGFTVESMQAGRFRKLRATRKVDYGPGIFDAAHRANTILSVPDWLVGYLRDAIGQSERRGEPLDVARLVRRTMLPASVLLAAKSLADNVSDEASEVPPAEDSVPGQKEFAERTSIFMDALDVDETVAQLLASEGFRTVEEIAYMELRELASIEGFDDETAAEIQSRAQAHLAQIEAEFDDKRKALGATDELKEVEGLTSAMLVEVPPAEDSVPGQKEVAERTGIFMDALDVDETVAQLLASEGFRTVEEIAYVELRELASIEGFDDETAAEIQSRAQAHLAQIEAEFDDKRKALGVADELKEVEGLTSAMLVQLGENGIKTLEDLADCASDDLTGWTDRGEGGETAKPGFLSGFDVTRARADAIILDARVRAGWIDAPETAAADEAERVEGKDQAAH
jgi:transcription termination factor NusA